MAENHEYLLDGLDDSQRRAASALAGPVRIVAVAGAGKTRTITRRIAYGCASGKWDPDRTVAVTFSVKAAREMQERLSKLGVGRVQASTFHALALSQLRRVWSEVTDDYFPTLVPDPTPVLAGVVEKLTDLKGASSREVRDILAEVNWTKVSLITPSQYPRVAAAFHRVPPAGLSVEQMVAVLDDFERVKAEQHVMDFNDILLILSHILEESEEAARIVRREVGWLTVDEYQDVSPLQHRLMTLWLGTNTDVCVVGDPAQTIYSFTGATSYYLEEFPREFPGITADVELSRDYRSTGAIVKYANTLLRHSQQPDVYLSLESLEPSGAGDTEMPVNRHAYGTDAQEAKRVAGEIRKLLDSGVSAGEVAVLTRINAQLRTVNQACDDAGIPSMVRRVAGQGLEEGSFSQAVREGVSDGNIESLNTPMVTLSTIHAAKGLEWDHVFVIGVSEGLIPFGQSEDDAHLEEERRLLYVAVTRGRTSVSLSYARKKDETSSYERAPSRFLTR